MIRFQTCRHCSEIEFDETTMIRTGYRHWMHRACISTKYIVRIQQRIPKLLKKSDDAFVLGQNARAARLKTKAERLELLLTRIGPLQQATFFQLRREPIL